MAALELLELVLVARFELFMQYVVLYCLSFNNQMNAKPQCMTIDVCWPITTVLPGVTNPIQVAARIAEESRHVMPLGRVRPM